MFSNMIAVMNAHVLLIAALFCCGSQAGLYGFNDQVIEISKSNFKANIENSNTAWVVEFYASWCQDCRTFKSKYVEFARDVKGINEIMFQ